MADRIVSVSQFSVGDGWTDLRSCQADLQKINEVKKRFEERGAVVSSEADEKRRTEDLTRMKLMRHLKDEYAAAGKLPSKLPASDVKLQETRAENGKDDEI